MRRSSAVVHLGEIGALCRLCMKNHELCQNIFISNKEFEITVDEAIHDLLNLRVAIGDGLPCTACLQCVRKLAEFRDFKVRCLNSDTELRKFSLGCGFRSNVKEETDQLSDSSTEREAGCHGNVAEDSPQGVARLNVMSDPLVEENLSYKEEAEMGDELLAVEDSNRLERVSAERVSAVGEFQVTEVYIPMPDQLAMGNVCHLKEENCGTTENAIVQVKEEEEVDEERGHCVEGDVTSLLNVAVDPLNVENMVCSWNGAISDKPAKKMRNSGAVVADTSASGVQISSLSDSLCEKNSESNYSVTPSVVPTYQRGRKLRRKYSKTYRPNTSAKRASKFNNKDSISQGKDLQYSCNQETSVSNLTEYICDYCGRIYTDIMSLVLHINGHSVDNISAGCEIPQEDESPCCSSISPDHKNLETFLACDKIVPRFDLSSECGKLGVGKIFRCEKCGREFNHARAFSSHAALHDDKMAFKCYECGRVFARKGDLKKHTLIHTGWKPFKCDVCQKTFNQRSHLNRHAIAHADLEPFKCDACGKAFKQLSNLKRHESIHAGVRLFQCKVCGRAFNEKGDMKKHESIHSGLKPFKCDICGKEFRQRSRFKAHEAIHTGVKLFKCGICGKAGDSNGGDVGTLEGSHTCSKPFECVTCGKKFARKGELKVHSATHSVLRPFECNECGKAYKSKGALKGHVDSHIVSKLFFCDVCGKSFTYRTNLKRHEAIHSGRNRFKCSGCEKSFTRKDDLNKHVASHAGLKPYNCDSCTKEIKKEII